MLKARANPVQARGRLRYPTPDRAAANAAANAFPDRWPDLSARETLTRTQAKWFKQCFALVGCAGLAWPMAIVTAVGGLSFLFFTAALMFRLWLAWKGSQPVAVRLPDMIDVYPVYSVLVALKDEAAIVGQLSASLSRLDYPADKLDLKLLLEEGDDATLAAIRQASWPEGAEVLILPAGKPRTKPRALNYGLARAKGEFVVIYDAEDRPHPGQLKSAVAAFARGDQTMACVQAPLIGTPRQGSWIAGQWALEYAVQFGAVLPAMAGLGLPIMLGGTSNHFRRQALVNAGAWDAWNVTEDADLGLRLARLGRGVGVISQPTFETPPETLRVWVAQRSRWLKGFMQTWLVLMRHPREFYRAFGIGRFIAVQLSLGAAILSGLVHGVWALACLAVLMWPGQELPGLVWGSLGAAYLGGALIALAGGRAARWLLVLSLPFYWPLQTLAAWRALFELVRRPHFWAKTPH